MNIDQIRRHIDKLIKEKGKNYRALSMAIGKNEAYLHQYINKGSPVRLPEEQRRKLAALLNVDEQDLTDIKLPKFIETPSLHTSNTTIEMVAIDPSLETQFKTAGYWSAPLSDLTNISAKKSEYLKMLHVTGDSMQPTVKDGDYIFTDISLNTFSGDGLYLILHNKNVLLRRLQQVADNEVLLICDNTNYKAVSTPIKKIKVIGKIVYALKAEKIN